MYLHRSDCSPEAIRGRLFDSEGGPGTFGRDRLFIFITCSAGKFISGLTEDRIFIFNRNNFLKSKKKKKKKKGGGVMQGFSRGGRTWLSL